MKKAESILISHQKHISPDVFNELKNDLLRSNIELELFLEDEHHNYEWMQMSDVVIYIRDFIPDTVIDIIAIRVIALCKKLNRKLEDNFEMIKIEHETEGPKTVIINISGDFDASAEIITKSLEILKGNEYEKVFANENYVQNTGYGDIIEMNYSLTSKSWEPVNFTEVQKQWNTVQIEAKEKV